MSKYIDFKRKLTKGGGSSTSYRISVPEEIIQKMEVKPSTVVIWRLHDTGKVEVIFEDEVLFQLNQLVDEFFEVKPYMSEGELKEKMVEKLLELMYKKEDKTE